MLSMSFGARSETASRSFFMRSPTKPRLCFELRVKQNRHSRMLLSGIQGVGSFHIEKTLDSRFSVARFIGHRGNDDLSNKKITALRISRPAHRSAGRSPLR